MLGVGKTWDHVGRVRETCVNKSVYVRLPPPGPWHVVQFAPSQGSLAPGFEFLRLREIRIPDSSTTFILTLCNPEDSIKCFQTPPAEVTVGFFAPKLNIIMLSTHKK